MGNKQDLREITHPDDFVENRTYSALVQRKVSFLRRTMGTFLRMDGMFCEVCKKYHLVLVFVRKGKIETRDWGTPAITDWRENSAEDNTTTRG